MCARATRPDARAWLRVHGRHAGRTESLPAVRRDDGHGHRRRRMEDRRNLRHLAPEILKIHIYPGRDPPLFALRHAFRDDLDLPARLFNFDHVPNL